MQTEGPDHVQGSNSPLAPAGSRGGARRWSAVLAGLHVVFLALGWILLLSRPVQADPPVVTLATLDWKPYVSEDLPKGGFTTEIVREAFRRAGYGIDVHVMPWVRVLSEVEKGAFDAMYPAYHSARRARVYALSNPIAHGPLVLCKRSDRRIRFRSLEDLKPYRIGVVRGYVNTPAFDAADDLDKEMVNSDKQNLLKVLTGRIDLAVVDKYTALQIIETSIPRAEGALDFVEPPLQVKPLHVGFCRQREGCLERLKAFNRALKEMQDQGVVRAIYAEQGLRAYPGPNGAEARDAF